MSLIRSWFGDEMSFRLTLTDAEAKVNQTILEDAEFIQDLRERFQAKGMNAQLSEGQCRRLYRIAHVEGEPRLEEQPSPDHEGYNPDPGDEARL